MDPISRMHNPHTYDVSRRDFMKSDLRIEVVQSADRSPKQPIPQYLHKVQSNYHFFAGDNAYSVTFSSQYYRHRIQPNGYTWFDAFEETIDVKSDLRYLDAHASPIPKVHGCCLDCISR